MTEKLLLIERLKSATGPSRDLDWQIHCRDGMLGVGAYGPHPIYTGSVDSALTLIPENWLTQLDEWEADILRERGPWQCILVRRGTRDDLTRAFTGRCDHAPSPAIAVCIAALSARLECKP